MPSLDLVKEATCNKEGINAGEIHNRVYQYAKRWKTLPTPPVQYVARQLGGI